MRRELKRKHHNGNGNIESVEPPPKIIKLVNDNFSVNTTVRAEFSLGDDDFKLLSPMLSGAGPFRGRKNTLDEFSQTAKRRSNSAKGSLTVPSVLSTSVVSPALSEKSWTPASNIAVEEYSPTAAHTSSVLTSRVQEMFKEAVQRQRHHHTTIHSTEIPTEDDDEG
uniref:Uncharacterized protein n=1 Tax=Heterorhabditis bacteriophora TaxID=37862 RepID=A0A1I7W7B5_HETBA